jgi:hypothetical protein
MNLASWVGPGVASPGALGTASSSAAGPASWVDSAAAFSLTFGLASVFRL